ncbi:type II secretion system protein GspD [Campylobacter fetus]|uniref:type II secretion system protein GspD n=1 Tax=Campylobacter fetus TaxID=196 RepID=UPI001650C82C|nr:type II and III secretion system protein [Campylobacter fetus]
MKKIIVFLMALALTTQAEQIKNNLFEFANIVSNSTKNEILISGNIDPSDFYFFTPRETANINLQIFKKMVELQGLRFLKLGSFYYVDNPILNDENATIKEEEPENLYYIKLKNNSFSEINNMLSLYDKNSTYISQDNAVVFKSTDKIYSEILSYSENFDNKIAEQVSFKIAVLETNLSDLKSRGTEINSLLKGVDSVDFRYFFNLITVPYTQNTNVTNQSEKFYGVLNFLDTNNITNIKSSPFLVAKNNTEVFFSNVKNIPYLTTTTNITNAQTQQQSNYSYKDVGLKLTLKPIIIKDKIDVFIHLIFENLLSNSDTLTPTTSKKELKSTYSLKKGDILVLSGINQENEIVYDSGVPFLKDIWLLSYLFSTTKKEITNSILTITIEVF